MVTGHLIRWSEACAALVAAVALVLLSFGHDVPSRPIPIVYAPDGSIAVLCIGDDAGHREGHVSESCEACRIAASLLPPTVSQPCSSRVPEVAKFDEGSSVLALSDPWRPDRARAPPIPT